MASKQEVNIIGIGTLNGMAKVRFGTDMVQRTKLLTKAGATRIDFIQLPQTMTRMDALVYLKAHANYQSAEDQATIDEAIENRTPKVTKPRAAKSVKVKDKKAISLDSIKQRAKKPAVQETPEVVEPQAA